MVPDTHPPRSHSSMCGEKRSQHLSKYRQLSTDLSTRSMGHGRYRRSMPIHQRENTVDINGRCRFTHRELRLIVDRRLKIDIILWWISSTTPVDLRPWWVQWWKEPGVGLVSQSQRNQDLKAQQFKSRICWSGVSNSWLYMKRAVARSRPFRGVHTRERVQIDKKSTGGPPVHREHRTHRHTQIVHTHTNAHARTHAHMHVYIPTHTHNAGTLTYHTKTTTHTQHGQTHEKRRTNGQSVRQTDKQTDK